MERDVPSSESRLAPFAQSEHSARGRDHLEEPHPFRSEFQRDRDRIVHCRAFRKLEGKAHVFLESAGLSRTRLAHAVAVASVSTGLCRALDLNGDLAGAIALALHLGSPPFGHAGLRALHELMIPEGGFHPLRQSLRIVDDLEVKYPEFNGLNLTWELREALKAPRLPDDESRARLGFAAPSPSLEAQCADLANEIVAICLDFDDGLEMELFSEADLDALPLWRETERRILKRYPRLESPRRNSFTVRSLLNALVTHAADASRQLLAERQFSSADAARQSPHRSIVFPESVTDQLQIARDFLHEHFYHHPTVAGINQRSAALLEHLFETFCRNPSLMGSLALRRIKRDGERCAACDHLASLTDSGARLAHARLIGDGDPLRHLLPLPR